MIGIYARVSTEEQARTGFSLQDQIKECKKKARTNEVIEYIDDGFSGEFLDRPALTKLRNDVKEGIISKVICLDPDRLSRKLMNQLIITDEFDRLDVELIFVNGEYAKTAEGQLFYSMRGAIAEFEKAKINERMSRGRREKARQGRVVRDYQIYGYDYDKETEQFIINESEAEIVRLIFDLFTKPNDLVRGINGIAKYLTEKGVPTKRGANVWHRQVVRQMLMNRAYIGKFYQNRWNTEGMLGNKHKPKDERIPMKERPREEWIPVPCPAIIDRQTFDHAQNLLSESRRRWAKQSKRRYLLSGLLRCAKCGNTMTGRKHRNWGADVFIYTDEKNYSGAKHPGCGMRVRCEKLDKDVWDKISHWLNNPDEIATVEDETDEVDFEQAEIIRLETEIKKAKEGRKRLLNLFAEGLEIGQEEIRESLKGLKRKEEHLTEELEELKKRYSELSNKQYSANLIKEAAAYYLNHGKEELSFDDKQALIRYVVKEIRVYKDGIEIYTF